MKFRVVSGIMLTLLIASMLMVLLETASPTPAVTQTDPTTMVYLDPATINGTEIGVGNTVTVNINISDAVDIYGWQAGMIFNPTLLECTGFSEGEFLSDQAGPEGTQWIPALINNTAGLIEAHGCTLKGDYKATGDGRLAYLTFEVKELGVSSIHLRDVMVQDYHDPTEMVSFNIIDVYTVLVDTTDYTVVTVSNSTGQETVWDPEAMELVLIHSGFYDHSFNETLKELSFKVTGPYPGFSNVTIPKALLEPEPTYAWGVIIDGSRLRVDERTLTENATHTSIYFTYSTSTASQLFHNVQITPRFASSTISMTLSSINITLGSTVTISGGIVPLRPLVTVTIEYRPSGALAWTTLATVPTDSNGNYTYTWKPEKTGTYEVRARWAGDETYLGAVSEVWILTVYCFPGLVHNINTALNYCTIQEAIDANETLDGHTILVDAGTYYERVTIDKSISLIGENRSTTIIDGNYTRDVIRVTADNVNITGFTIQNGGYGVYLDCSSNNTVSGNNITNNYDGVSVHVSYNTISFNNITNNDIGIGLYSHDNTVSGNNITNNGCGIRLHTSYNNTIYHNNFVDNTQQVYDPSWEYYYAPSINDWDDGYPSGGNYWSDYTGVDADHDGIGDTAHIIDVNNKDNHPLMGMFSDFPVTHQQETYHITTICNSTITEFQFNDIAKTISFNVTGPDYTLGFCRVTIPNIIVQDLWKYNYTVLVDGKKTLTMNNWTDGTYTYIYFTYQHSEHRVEIIPEFPTWTSMLLILIVLTVATAIYKRRLIKTPIH